MTATAKSLGCSDMLSVQLDCEAIGCLTTEYVDVYERDLIAGVPLNCYVPEGWLIVASAFGLATAYCPDHEPKGTP